MARTRSSGGIGHTASISASWRANMTSATTLGKIIRARRRELRLTQEELAERISADGEFVRQSDISRLERGAVMLPRRARLERIAAALDLSLGELLARSGWAGADEYFDELVATPAAQPADR